MVFLSHEAPSTLPHATAHEFNSQSCWQQDRFHTLIFREPRLTKSQSCRL